ncbi:MAG TPA: DUF4129 domain-containing protein [Caldilineae bacterium]|nr:DUF4129 domain-containing protein [Caldilineae bacterium]
MEGLRRQGEPLQDSLWLRGVFRPLMVALLAVCLAVGFVSVAWAVVPGWGRGLVLPFLSLVALEAVYTTLWLASPERRDRRTARFRAGELLCLLILARLLAFLIVGEWPSPALLLQWLRTPLSFIDGASFFLGFLTLVTWGQATLMMGTLEHMSLKPDELVTKAILARDMDWNEIRARHPSRTILLEQFSAYWLWGGVMLALCAGLSRLEWRPVTGRLIGLRHLGLSPMLQIALVVYFLGGLALVSQGRLAVLRARWQYEGTPVDPAVVRRWGRLAIGMLILVGLVAALLPFGSSFALARVLATLINVAMQVAYVFLLLLFGLFGWLLGLLWRVSGDAGGESPWQRMPEPPEGLSNGFRFPDWLGGALVWLIMISIVAYSLVAYLRGRGVRLELKWLRRLWDRLRAWWQGWQGQARRWGQRVRAAVIARRSRSVAEGRPLWRFLSLRRLSPRDRVRYFYLSTVRRASERGVRRRPSETPREYQEDLTSHWPEIGEDLIALTEAFIDARYSAREMRPEEAKRVQEIWKRVKASLRKHPEP